MAMTTMTRTTRATSVLGRCALAGALLSLAGARARAGGDDAAAACKTLAFEAPRELQSLFNGPKPGGATLAGAIEKGSGLEVANVAGDADIRVRATLELPVDTIAPRTDFGLPPTFRAMARVTVERAFWYAPSEWKTLLDERVAASSDQERSREEARVSARRVWRRLHGATFAGALVEALRTELAVHQQGATLASDPAGAQIRYLPVGSREPARGPLPSPVVVRCAPAGLVLAVTVELGDDRSSTQSIALAPGVVRQVVTLARAGGPKNSVDDDSGDGNGQRDKRDSPKRQPLGQVTLLAVSGVAFLAALISAMALRRKLTRLQQFLMLLLMALAAGALSSAIPGAIDFEQGEKLGVKATGGLAAFAFVMVIGTRFLSGPTKRKKDAPSVPAHKTAGG